MTETPIHARRLSWSRRDWLKGSLLATGATLGLAQRVVAAPTASRPLLLPPDWPGRVLAVNEANLSIWSGSSTPVLAINGSVPGPTIRLRKGEVFSAQVRNQLDTQDLVLHWHGLLAPSANDGHPRQVIPPGSYYTVSFEIVQEPSMCWYHTHTHGLTAEQVYKGIAGLILIEDPERDAALGLPTGDHDIPLVIRDWKSNAGHALTYAPTMFEQMWGYLGDTILVNGTPDPYLDVDQGLWRFRVLNGCNARVLRLAFSDNRSFHVVGSDGGLTGMIEATTSLDLAPGQRAEILVSFSDLSVGQSAFLKSLAFSEGRPGGGPAGPRQGDYLDVMEFYVSQSGGSAPLPTSLPAPRFPNPDHAVRTRTFTLASASGSHTINGVTYDMNRNDFTVPAGEVEVWEFVNTSGMHHPMHSHGAFFQVLTRNGSPATLPTDRGWRDTVLVYPNETVRVAAAFGSRSGEYLMHCHNLEHEHQMMQNFTVSPAVEPDLEILREGGEVICRWPANLGGWLLETSTDLDLWEPVAGDPVVVGAMLEWRQPDTDLERFFQLRLV